MSTIVTRAVKGLPLTWSEVDSNFTNLNTDKLDKVNNLSDVTNATTARTNLNAQTYNANLTTVGNTITAAGLALIDDANVAAQRTTLGLVIGTDVQAYSPILTSISNNNSDLFYRNLLINGDFRIDTRGNTSVAADNTLHYMVDRWYAFCTGAAVTVQPITSGPYYRLRTTGATSNTTTGLAQRITSDASKHLAGSTAYLQVKAYSDNITSLNWALYYASSNDSFGTLASPTRTLISNGTFTINTVEATYSTSISIPSNATTGLELVFTTGPLTSGHSITFGDVQLEKNNTLGFFEIRPLEIETMLCRYYFQKMHCRNYLVSAGGSGSYYIGASWFPMRASPSVTTILQGLDGNTTSASLTVKSQMAGYHVVTATGSGAFGADSSFYLSAEL